MGLPQRETSGEEGAPHGHGILGCFGNSFKKNISYNTLILVSAEDAQTQCADHLLRFILAFL